MIKRKSGFNGERAIILPQSVIQEMESDSFSSVLHITDIGYYPKAQNHYREREEPITQFIFIYCIEGKGWYRTDTQEHTVTANQYFIIPAGKPHVYGADSEEPWTIYWIHFKGKLASYFASHCTSPIEVNPGIKSRISNRIDLFEEIFRTLEMGHSRENLFYACTTFYHYLGTLRYLQQYRNAISDVSGNSDIMTEAIHFMQENIEKKISLQQMADHLGYSSSHFSTLFSKRTGYSPLTYFNQLKIQKACQLLDFTDMKINQICYKVGIDDMYYFSRLFSKIMGLSPKEYRKTKKG